MSDQLVFLAPDFHADATPDALDEAAVILTAAVAGAMGDDLDTTGLGHVVGLLSRYAAEIRDQAARAPTLPACGPRCYAAPLAAEGLLPPDPCQTADTTENPPAGVPGPALRFPAYDPLTLARAV